MAAAAATDESAASRWGDDARRIAGLVLLRILITSALFGAALSTSSSGGETEGQVRSSLYAFLLLAYASAAFELVWILTRRALKLLAWTHMAVETLLASWLVALTGGPAGPFSFLLLLSTVHGAIAAGSAGGFAAASLATVLLGSMGANLSLPVWIAPLIGQGDSSRVAAAVFANSGGCFATAALSSYLTERLQRTGRELSARETELRGLGELYMSVVQSLSGGLMTLTGGKDGHSRITLLNEAGGDILGVTPSQARGRTVDQLSPELDVALRDSKPDGTRGECSLARDGHHVLVGFAVSTLRGPDGETLGSVVAFQDVTELRRLEASVRRQSHLASLGELSAGLAHEIRNPLAALSGAVQMLAVAPASEEDGKLLDLVRRESSHLGKLVSDFLTFARPPPPAPQDGDLSTLVRECCEAFDGVASSSGRRLTKTFFPTPARFDPDQLRQVVGNLLRNALEATAQGGRIDVSVASVDGVAILAVADDGPGISPENSKRIFEPFFTTKEKGTGLGLAFVARIIGAHDGTIDIEQSSWGGARFVVRLPGGAGS